MKITDQQRLYYIAMWVFMVGYTPSVYAAEIFLGPMNIPVIEYLYVAWMATWGASAAFLQKYATGQIPATLRGFTLHATKDLINSNLAAILVFMLCQHFGVPKPLEAISYTLAGYGGARTMEAVYQRWVATATAGISRATGLPIDVPPPPPPDAPPSPPL